jgi:hypothetical protein
VGNWGVGLADRFLRFVGVSIVFQTVFAPLSLWIWRTFILTGRFRAGDLPLAAWPIAIAYVLVPIVVGVVVGRGTLARRGWAKFFTGPSPAPRAWDHLFGLRPDGWVRLRLKSGAWIGGAYSSNDDGIDSYAAGYPDEQDLFIAEAYVLDPKTGEFVLDEHGDLVQTGSAILVRWSEIEYLDFIDA